MASATEKSLYERLGGYDAIAAVTDSILERLFADAVIGGYWSGHSSDTKRTERQLIVDYLCDASGGPTFYTGRTMGTSHQGMGINEADYDILMEHCVATLDLFYVPEREKDDVCSFLNGLREEIIQRA